MPAQTVIQLRRDTAANWTSTDPTLAAGEAGFETDTSKLKIGDGSTAWSSLAYFGNLDSLNNVGDVIITSAATGQVLQFDGSDWVNADVLPDETGHTNSALFTGGPGASYWKPIGIGDVVDLTGQLATAGHIYQATVVVTTAQSLAVMPTTLDGVDVSDGSPVLLVAQTNNTENGIWNYSSKNSEWTQNENYVYGTGRVWYIADGSMAGSAWQITNYIATPSVSGAKVFEAYNAQPEVPDYNTGDAGKFLTNDGIDVSWATVDLSSKQDVVAGVTSTEIGYLDGVTSGIQEQLDSKASSTHTHAIADVTNLQSALDTIPSVLNDLSDVNGNTAGQMLFFNGQGWEAVSDIDKPSFTGAIKEKIQLRQDPMYTSTYYLSEGAVLYFYVPQSSQQGGSPQAVSLNLTWSQSEPLYNFTAGQSITSIFIVKNGPTSYRYVNNITIDGSPVTVYWQGGAPTDLTLDGVDVYSFNITRDAEQGWLVLANHTSFEQ